MYRVFRKWQYGAVAFLGAFLIHATVVYAQQSSLLMAVMRSAALTVLEKIAAIAPLFALHVTTPAEALFEGLLPILVGINIALLIFYIRFFRTAPSTLSFGGGIAGSLAAFLGIGCAACGSIFLAAFASTLGAGGILALLPRGGEELGYLGIALLLVSIFTLSRTINKPPVCPI
jgi:hypothetical protein